MQTVTKGFGLSIQQTHLYTLQGKSPAYQAFCQVRIEGRLNLEIFQRALHTMVARYAILRVQLYSIPGIDVPIQVFSDKETDTYFLVSLEDIEPSQQKKQMTRYVEMIQERPSDLEQDHLLKCILIRLSHMSFTLLINLPALCADAVTLRQFFSELTQIYHAYATGIEYSSEEPLQYTDVSAWQDELIQDEDVGAQRAFWQKIDLSLLDTLFLPFAQQAFHSHVRTPDLFKPQTISINMADEKTYSPRLSILLEKTGTSPEAFWLACWLTTIWRLINQKATLLGVECDGRYHEELSDVLGLCSRVIPFHVPLTKTWSFERLLVLVHAALEEAKRLQIYFSWDALSLTSERKSSDNYFPISFAYDEWPVAKQGAGVTFLVEQSSSCIEPFALKLHVLRIGQEFNLNLCYDPQYFSYFHIQSLAKSLNALQSAALLHADEQISALPILSLQDQLDLQQCLAMSALSATPQTLMGAFEEQVRHYPERVVLVCENEHITYGHLNLCICRLAQVLRSEGVRFNMLVGLYVERSIDMLVGMLAILKAGGGYVPLDPDQPVARLMYQIQDLQLSILLTQTHLLNHLSPWNGVTLCLDAPQIWKNNRLISDLPRESSPEGLAYIIYTSGSTGVPKGVMIQHKSVANYVFALCERLALQDGLRFATVSTLCADLGNTVIFCSLVSGGCLHILKYEAFTSGEMFADYMMENSIDVLKIAPSHLSALLASRDRYIDFPRKYLIIGGEALSLSLLYKLQEMQCPACIVNHYGPTEATIGSLVNVIGKAETSLQVHAQKQEALTVPIGQPIAGMEAYILDQCQQILPLGATGELYLAGVGLAAGYWRQPGQTAERFIAHPWSKIPGALLYRTGDLVRYNVHGSVEFVGRIDSQVKLRGYRVELGEVEAILKKHSEVRECVVVVREDTPGDKRLVAYIVAQHLSTDEEVLRSFMQEQVPEYMIPSFFVFLRVLPFNANGKVDRDMLPPPLSSEERHRNYVAPRTPVEEILAGIWRSVLQVKQISVYDTFYSLGGHSLLATLIISRICQALKINISLRDLFDNPTISGLSEYINKSSHSEHNTGVPAISSVERGEALPLSFAQQRLWFLNQLEPDSSAYNIPMAVRLEGVLNIYALTRSLETIISRHENLRTRFSASNGIPVQIIHPACTYLMPVVDLQGIPPHLRDIQVQYLSNQHAQKTFDLEKGPLLRTMLLLLDYSEYIILHAIHHIVSDAWSRNIFIDELIALYNAFIDGKSHSLPDLPIQYADFACWQRQWLQGEILQVQLDYWTKRLNNIPRLEFPTDHPYPPVQTFRGNQVRLLQSVKLSEAIKQLCQHEGSTLFMVLLAAFQVLLAHYTHQNDISVGTPIANRSQPETERLIGFFMNTLVIRTDLSGNPTFREVVAQVREVMLDAYAHQDVPFERLVELLQPERNMAYSPLFQVMFQLQHKSSLAPAAPLQGVAIHSLDQSSKASKFALTLSIMDLDQELSSTIIYNTDLFNESTMTLLLEHWNCLLETIIDDPEQHLAELSFLTKPERQQLLVEWNSTRDADFPQGCIHAFFEKQAEFVPDTIAAVYVDEHITYQKLNIQANQLSHYLRSRGVKQGDIVGISVERSLIMITGILGVLKAGSGYVPLDPAYPPERLSFMLEDAAVAMLLTQQHMKDQLSLPSERVVYLDNDWGHIQQQSNSKLQDDISPDSIAYVIYTSGSTGHPKGTVIPHRAVANFIRSMCRYPGLTNQDRLLAVTSLSFDIAFLELLLPLTIGACTQIGSSQVVVDGRALAHLIDYSGATVLQATPSTWRMLLLADWSGNTGVKMLCGGEPLSKDLAWKLLDRGPELWNMYGPTETTIWSALCKVSKGQEKITVGRPIANTQLYLLNQFYKPVPLGVAGELYIGGAGLAWGYLNRPEQTAERFIPDPFTDVPGGRLYRTGDSVRYQVDGTIEYLGRLDFQVKIRGYRIELAEVEVAISRYPGVKEVVVYASDTAGSDKRLVAYIVFDLKDSVPQHHDLRRYLQRNLPEYMIPSAFVYLESIPLTANRKVDYRALSSLSNQSPFEMSTHFVAPRTSAETVLADIWKDVLGVQVGVYDNFFDIGGHSLLATQLISRVSAIFQIDFPISRLFEAPTIDGLIEELANMRGGRDLIEEIAQIFQEISALTEDEIGT